MNRLKKSFGFLIYDIPQEFKAAYKKYHHDLSVLRLNLGWYFCIILIPGAFVFDMLIFPDQWIQLLKVRVATGVVCFILYLVSNKTIIRNYPSYMIFLQMTVASAAIAYLAYLTGATSSPYYAGLILVCLAIALVIPLGYKGSVIAGFLVLISYLSINLLPQLVSGEFINWPLFWNSVYFLTFSSAMIIVSSGILENNRRQIFVRTEEEKIRSEKLAESKRKIDELLKTKSRFISNITHELKTPLSIILGSTEIILDQADNISQETRDQLNIIQVATKQLSTHVDRIIKISSSDDPEQKLIAHNYNYSSIIENTFAMFEAKAKKEKIKYTLDLPRKSLIAHLDILRIQEVVSNLIQNAFKFTEKGGSIHVAAGTDGDEIYTEITDTGVGIPADQLDRIFDRLYQVDETLAKSQGGIGLGLYICKQNVELHGGKISAHSSVGEGTSFRFTLPHFVDQEAAVEESRLVKEERRSWGRRRKSVDRRQEDRRLEEREKRLEYHQQLGLDDLAEMLYTDNIMDYQNKNPQCPSVLLVEDNLGMMKVMVEALREDHNLFLAQTGGEGLKKLRQNGDKIALILSDIMMPEMSGFDFCRKVMANPHWLHIPLIFVTALMEEEEQLKGYELGATDYIVKPYNIKILKEKVSHWITRRQYELILQKAFNTVEAHVKELSKIKDIIIHEIRNPLQLISGAGYLLQKSTRQVEPESDEQKKKWSRSFQMLNQGVDSIKSVLETSKDLEKRGYQAKEPEDIDTLLDDALEQVTPMLRDVTLSVKLKNMSGCQVLCDKRMLTQVFVNLIRNAVESIHETRPKKQGKITVSAKRQNQAIFILKFSDNGKGIPKDVQEKLFKFKFSTKKDGMGIGLHLAKMILKIHNGDIQLESIPGKGSTFNIYLPFHHQ